MTDSSVDLNIENYSLDELLALFNLPQNYDFTNLKQVFIKYVAPLHPDKSGLPSDYFIFYKKAYGILLNIYKMRNKNTSSSTKSNINYLTSYNDELKEYEEQHRLLAEKLLKSENFNDTFNKLFEDNVKTSEEVCGYEEWLRGNEENERPTNYNILVKQRTNDLDKFKNENRKITMSEFQSEFERRRAEIISGNEIISRDVYAASSLSSVGSSTLLNGSVDDYSSSFGCSGLAYQDLKRAHTNTLIDVDENKMNDRFMRSGDYENYLKSREKNITALTKEESEKILNQQYKTEEETNIRNTFKLLQQQEQQQKVMDKVWSKLKHIAYK
jgi:hypothetical protein